MSDHSDPVPLDGITWRTSLTALRAMSTDPSAESNIYERVVDMRENVKSVTMRQTGKYERRILMDDNCLQNEKYLLESGTSDQPNLYALNIKGMLGLEVEAGEPVLLLSEREDVNGG